MEEKQSIPLVPLADGSFGYDCDIFGDNNIDLTQFDHLKISGNLCVGNNFISNDISVGESAFFGEYANVCDVYAGKDVYFSTYADTFDIMAHGNVSFGEFAFTFNVQAGKNIYFDAHAHTGHLTAGEDISVYPDHVFRE